MHSSLQAIYVNDDGVTFTAAFPSSFHAFAIHPFRLLFSRKEPTISIGSITTAQGYCLVAVSGLPADPQFTTQSVCVFNNGVMMFRHTLESHILSIRISPNFLILGFHDEIQLWDFMGAQLSHRFTTGPNVHAPMDVSYVSKVLVCGGDTPVDLSLVNLENLRRTNIKAADNPLALINFSTNSPLVATTSSAGHTIKVWNSLNGKCIVKCKRSNKASIVYSTSFSPDNRTLLVVTQNGCLHFFRIPTESKKAPTKRADQMLDLGINGILYSAWITENRIAIASMNGVLLIVTLSQDFSEIARESVPFVQKIIEENEE